MKKILLLLAAVVLLSAIRLDAQPSISPLPPCGYDLIWQSLEQDHPGLRAQYTDYLRQQAKHTAAKPTGTVYRIPVVFHIVYYKNGPVEKGNLADSVIQWQMIILNDAFRKKHADTGNLRSYSKPLSADAEIEFYLATTDPSGVPTTGITRTPTTKDGFGWNSYNFVDSIERIKHTAKGGYDGWPTNRYLNIWVGDMRIRNDTGYIIGTIGVGTPPLNPLPPNWDNVANLNKMKDGVMLQYQYVGGDKNPYWAESAFYGYTKGRLAAHEVGHYLGLCHIWGNNFDTTQFCAPNADDGIDDTPAQAYVSYNHPPDTKNTCHAGESGDLPDLWENYMDYTDDAYIVMFTHEQVGWMRGILKNQRDTLLNQYTDINDLAQLQASRLKVYPQPAAQQLIIDLDGKTDYITLTDLLGKTVWSMKGNLPRSKSIDISSLSQGIYFLRIQSGSDLYGGKQVVIQR
jgi:hypothetical protein